MFIHQINHSRTLQIFSWHSGVKYHPEIQVTAQTTACLSDIKSINGCMHTASRCFSLQGGQLPSMTSENIVVSWLRLQGTWVYDWMINIAPTIFSYRSIRGICTRSYLWSANFQQIETLTGSPNWTSIGLGTFTLQNLHLLVKSTTKATGRGSKCIWTRRADLWANVDQPKNTEKKK